MRIHEYEGLDYYDEDFKHADAEFAFGDCYGIEAVKKINKIIEKAESLGFSDICIVESNTWNLKDVFFYFGDKRYVKKQLILKTTPPRGKIK